MRAAPAADDNAVRKIHFHGDGGSLFGMIIINALLSVCTLGIYHFWGKVKVRKFFYSHTELDGDRFSFHGTGKELLFSYLKIMGFFIAFVAMLSGAMAAMMAVFGKKSPLALLPMVIVYPLMLALIPYAIVGARRYFLSRSSFRGIRFSFRGTGSELIGPFIKGSLLSALTLGFYLPYFITDLQRFFVSKSYYGDRPFSFDGQGKDLFGPYLRAFFLSFVTFGLYMIWFQAERERYMMAHTRFGSLRFQSSVTGGGLLGLAITNGLLVLFTFGLGLPWALCRLVRFHCDNLQLSGSLGPVKQDMQYASATGEELANALDVGAGFGM